MLKQTQIDQLTAAEYSRFLSNEQEFCEDPRTIGYKWSRDLYTSEHLDCLGDIQHCSDGGQDWIASLDSMMCQIMTSGISDEHCMST